MLQDVATIIQACKACQFHTKQVHQPTLDVAYLHLENGKVPMYSENPRIDRLHTQSKMKYHNKILIITRGSSTKENILYQLHSMKLALKE